MHLMMEECDQCFEGPFSNLSEAVLYKAVLCEAGLAEALTCIEL